MNHDPRAAEPPGNPDILGWRQVLDDVERSLRDASRAIALLRRSLEDGSAEAPPAGGAPQQVEAAARPPEQAPPDAHGAGRSPFERLWDRMEAERMDTQQESLAEGSSERRGLDLLPHQYLVTVEDRESIVELAPLHRALATLADANDISLVSFANGVPVISVRVEGELDLERLREAVSIAMDRDCEMIPQDNGRLHLRLRSQQDARGQ